MRRFVRIRFTQLVLLFLLSLLLGTVACSFGPSGGTTPDGGAVVKSMPGAGGGQFDASNEGTGLVEQPQGEEQGGETAPGSTPAQYEDIEFQGIGPVSVPAPTLTIPTPKQGMVVADAQYVRGDAGSVPEEYTTGDYALLITYGEKTGSAPGDGGPRSSQPKHSLLAGICNIFMPEAHALSIENNLCTAACAIGKDGSFFCKQPEEAISFKSIFISITNCVERGPPLEVARRNNIHLGNYTSVTGFRGSQVMTTIGNEFCGDAVEFNNRGTAGTDHGSKKNENCVQGDEVVYEDSDSLFGVLEKKEGIHVIDEVTLVEQCLTSVPEASHYTVMKKTGGQILFGIESKKPSSEAYLYDAFGCVFKDPQRNFQFVSKGDTDVNGKELLFKKTYAFDVDSRGYTIISWEGEDKQFRLTVTNGFEKYGGGESLTGKYEFKDIQVYQDGKFLILDSKNDQVGFGLYDVMSNIDIEGWMPVGKNPQAMALSPDRSHFCVVNEGDDSVTCMSLLLKDGEETRPQTCNIRDYLDIHFRLKPFEIAYTHDRWAVITNIGLLELSDSNMNACTGGRNIDEVEALEAGTPVESEEDSDAEQEGERGGRQENDEGRRGERDDNDDDERGHRDGDSDSDNDRPRGRAVPVDVNLGETLDAGTDRDDDSDHDTRRRERESERENARDQRDADAESDRSRGRARHEETIPLTVETPVPAGVGQERDDDSDRPQENTPLTLETPVPAAGVGRDRDDDSDHGARGRERETEREDRARQDPPRTPSEPPREEDRDEDSDHGARDDRGHDRDREDPGEVDDVPVLIENTVEEEERGRRDREDRGRGGERGGRSRD